MNFRYFFVRNSDAPELIELFLVAAVASVLAIRGALAATGYPQLGGDGLHIAHMLWGGLFMTVALLMLFAALGRIAQRTAAILGGIGFGTFIDELGKFITSDNNYFYEPTIGLIYIIFIAIFLVLEAFRRQEPGPAEALANAFNQLELAAGRPLHAETKRTTLELLAKSDTSDPIVRGLTDFVRSIEPQPVPDMSFYFRARDFAVSLYSRVVLSRWFRPALIGLFLLIAFIQVGVVVLIAALSLFESTAEDCAVGLYRCRDALLLRSVRRAYARWHLAIAALASGCLPLVRAQYIGEHLRNPDLHVLGIRIHRALGLYNRHPALHRLEDHD